MDIVNVENDDTDVQQSTMWLGTEDGCIHIYNSSDNIRIKKNKFRLQHGSAILCIMLVYILLNYVFKTFVTKSISINKLNTKICSMIFPDL